MPPELHQVTHNKWTWSPRQDTPTERTWFPGRPPAPCASLGIPKHLTFPGTWRRGVPRQTWAHPPGVTGPYPTPHRPPRVPRASFQQTEKGARHATGRGPCCWEPATKTGDWGPRGLKGGAAPVAWGVAGAACTDPPRARREGRTGLVFLTPSAPCRLWAAHPASSCESLNSGVDTNAGQMPAPP